MLLLLLRFRYSRRFVFYLFILLLRYPFLAPSKLRTFVPPFFEATHHLILVLATDVYSFNWGETPSFQFVSFFSFSFAYSPIFGDKFYSFVHS